MKKTFIILFNTFLIILFLELIFKTQDLLSKNYFDNKKNIISSYSNYKNHPVIGYTARKNSAGKEIHYVPNTYFKTTTNSDGFRTSEFYPKHKKNFRIIILGDSFIYGMNANDNETIGRKLEQLYKRNISENIEVISMGVIGYSGLNYAGIARTYFEYLKPDLVILCIDQSDFNDDEEKVKIYEYEKDESGFPYFIDFKVDQKNLRVKSNRELEFYVDNKKNFIDKLKLESSLFNRLNKVRHRLKKINLDKRFNELLKKNQQILIYKDLSNAEKKNLYKIINSGDILKYDLEESKKNYTVTYNSIEYIKKKTDQINSKLVLSSYPYPWFINPNYGKFFQLKNFNKILDLRGNEVYPNLLDYYALKLEIENLNSYPYFKKTKNKLWGDYDPHFNAEGYEEYANFLYNETIKLIEIN